MKDRLLFVVSKVNVIKYNLAHKRHIRRRLIGCVVMLPSPHAGVFFCLYEVAILFLGIDQGYITFICFCFLIHNFEDSACTSHCHDDEVHLLGHLIDGHIEALVKGKEGCESAQGEAAYISEGKRATNNCDEHVGDVTDLCIGGHEDIRVSIRLIGCFEDFVIQLIKGFDCFFFMIEDLNNLLAVHHLFDVGIHRTDGLLLLDEVLAGQRSDLAGYHEHKANHEKSQDGKGHIQNKHTNQGHNDRDCRGDHLREGLA